MSQGTFYQYFSNKEEIFRELVDRVLADFWQKVNQNQGDSQDFYSRLNAGVGVLLEHCSQHQALHRILNEFELIDILTIGYYESMARYFRDFFRQAANQGTCGTWTPTWWPTPLSAWPFSTTWIGAPIRIATTRRSSPK